MVMRIPIIHEIFKQEWQGIARVIRIGDLKIYMTIDYPLGFKYLDYGKIVANNELSCPGDGKKLNKIEPDKNKRVSREEMLYLLDKCLVDEVMKRR